MKKNLFIFIFFIFLFSCISIPKKSLIYHTIDIKINGTINNGNTNQTILISNIEVLSPYNTKRICYSFRDHELKNYLFHLWASPLSNMIMTSLIFSQYQESKVSFIGADQNNTPYTYKVEIVIKKFLHKYYGKRSYAIVDMLFITTKGDLLRRKEYNIQVLCKNNTPYDAVIAFNRALNNIFSHFLNDLLKM